MSRILIVGKSFSGVTKRLKSAGHDYIILKDRREAANTGKRLKRVVFADFSSKESILVGVDAIKLPIDGVLVIYENYVLSAAWIAEHLGLPGMPPAAALACTDKWIMRQALATAPEPLNPDFAIVNSETDLIVFAKNHSFPLMLKPANLVKSLLITKNDGLEELLANYRQMTDVIGQVYATYAQDREPTIIVEEFLKGSMHTVAGFADQHGEPHIVQEVVDLQLAREIGFNDNFLYCRQLPSKLPDATQAALRRTAALGIRALGMKSSPAHVELIMTPDGPRIVEIGARNGGYRERMYDLANGLDLVQESIRIALGAAPVMQATKRDACAVLELFPYQKGVFKGITHLEKVRALPSCTYVSVKAAPGATVGKAADGFKRCAVIMLHSQNHTQLQADLTYINEHVKVVTEQTA